MFDLTTFISDFVTKRPDSMFREDLRQNETNLQKKIKGKAVLVIGGAGSISSSAL